MSTEITGPAIVTGGGQGLGRAFCRGLAARGAAVVVADLDGAHAEAVAKELRDEGAAALAVTVDVADEGSVAGMVERVLDGLGPPRVLVNNAAIFSTLAMKPFTEIGTEEWERVLRVNVTGTFLCCRHVIPSMAEQGYGKVINISSATVWIGRPGYLHYVTSKMAIVGLTRALASEVGAHGVRVNCITPGSTETEVERATITRADRKRMAGATALRRVQVADDLVGSVVFLAGPDSDFITGQTVNVDGGFTFH